MVNYSNDTEKIRPIVIDFLSDGEVKTKADIIDHVTKQLQRETSNGVLAGLLHKLVHTQHQYISPARGLYQYIGDSQTNALKSKVQNILTQTISSLEKEGQKLNPLEMSDEDMQTVKFIQNIIKTLTIELENFNNQD